EVSESEYADFYRHLSNDWTAPFKTLPLKAEGTIEYQSLLFIPLQAPPGARRPFIIGPRICRRAWKWGDSTARARPQIWRASCRTISAAQPHRSSRVTAIHRQALCLFRSQSRSVVVP